MNKTTCLISVMDPASVVLARPKLAVKSCTRIPTLCLVDLWDLLSVKSLGVDLRGVRAGDEWDVCI
jgi:hypothetical protein